MSKQVTQAASVPVPVYGKDKILMFRKLGETGKTASKLLLQVEHKWEYERKNETKATKDGAVVASGGLETKLSIEALSTRDEVNQLLADSVIQGFKLEVWEIDLAGEKQGSKYPAIYAQGSLSKWEVPANVEDMADFSTEMAIDGVPKHGFVALSDAQTQEVAYAFKDITAE